LSSIRIPQHGHVDQLQRILPRILDFRGEQNGARTGPKDGAALLCEFQDGFAQTFFLQELQLGRAFSTGKD